MKRSRGSGAELRLSQLGHDRFFGRLAEWITPQAQPVRLNPPGSQMLRLLIWYAEFADKERARLIVDVMDDYEWAKGATANKVVQVLSRFGST